MTVPPQWERWAHEGNGEYAIAIAIMELAKEVHGLTCKVELIAEKIPRPEDENNN